jgi:methyl acetate hydrolase
MRPTPPATNRIIDDALDAADVPGVAAAVVDPHGVRYHGSAGVRRVGAQDRFDLDTVVLLASATKAVTATAVLQLIDEGLVKWDEPATTYLPELDRIQVLAGFDDAGSPVLRPPRSPITPRTLLLHTSGFGYDNFSPQYLKLQESGHIVSQRTASRRSLHAPLLFDPGERWEYGLNSDWAGMLVEAVRGERLSSTLRRHVFEPLGMTRTRFVLDKAMARNRASVHRRNAVGQFEPTDFMVPQDAEIEMGGHGLYSTVADYARFLRMWLRHGQGEHGRVLSAAGVQAALSNGVGSLPAGTLRSVKPSASEDFVLFPGLSTGWAPLGAVVLTDAPTGRRSGSVSWAGLPNVYFWIDPASEVAGIWAAQVLPFADARTLSDYLRFERAVYSAQRPR